MKIPDSLKKKLLEMHYGVTEHAAVEICGWTKKHLRNKGSCYKRKFYGIDTNRCAQISPMAIWCEHNCIYCWRPVELMTPGKKGTSMPPEKMIEKLVKERKRLLSGIKGYELTDLEKFQDAYNLFPNHWAISLSGEPTLYDKLGELIKILRENKEVRSIFLVSNGQEPEALEKLDKKDYLPTQLYISVNAPNKKLYEKIANPNYPDGWQRLQRSLSLLKKIKTRTIIRFTLIKGINDFDKLLEEYASLFESAQPDFIEIKAFMFLGYSRKRLQIENMPSHDEVFEFSKKLEPKLPSYETINASEPSRIVLLKNKNSEVDPLIIFNDSRYGKVDKVTGQWTLYNILKKYRQVRRLLDKKGFDSWDKDNLTLEKQAKALGINAEEVVKEVNKFIKEEYLKAKST